MPPRYREPTLVELNHSFNEFRKHEKIFWDVEEKKPYSIPIENIDYYSTNVFTPLFATNNPQLIIAGFLWYAERQKSNLGVQKFVTQTLHIRPDNPMSFRQVIIYYEALLNYLNVTTPTPGARKDENFMSQLLGLINQHFYEVNYIHSAKQAIEDFAAASQRSQAAKVSYTATRGRLAATGAYLTSFFHDRTPERNHQRIFIMTMRNLAHTLVDSGAALHIEAIIKATALLLMYEIESVEKTKTSSSFLYFELAKLVGFPDRNAKGERFLPHTSSLPVDLKIMMCNLLSNFFEKITLEQWREAAPEGCYEIFYENYFLQFRPKIEYMRKTQHTQTSVTAAVSKSAWGCLESLLYLSAKGGIAYTAGQALAIGGIGAGIASNLAGAASSAVSYYGGAFIGYIASTPVATVTHYAVEKGLHAGVVLGLTQIFNRLTTKVPEADRELMKVSGDPFNTFLIFAIRLAPAGSEELDFLCSMQRLYNSYLSDTQKLELWRLLPQCYTQRPEVNFAIPSKVAELSPEERKTPAPVAPLPPKSPPPMPEVSIEAFKQLGGIAISPPAQFVKVVEPSAPPPPYEEDSLDQDGYVVCDKQSSVRAKVLA